MNKEMIKTQIEEKQAELKAIINRLEETITEGQKALARMKIMRLKREIESLTEQLWETGERPLSKEEVLHLIDEALDNKNKEDFMRLTDMLKAMS
jgi:uncharacterized protein YpiB (UPF0302 family)